MTRRLHIAGSASPSCSPELLRWTHSLVDRIVRAHVASGGTVLVQVSGDPRHAADADLRVLFDWTVMEGCVRALRDGANADRHGPLVCAICTSSVRQAVSAENEDTLAVLRDAAALDVLARHGSPGSVASSAGLLRSAAGSRFAGVR
jgi:hypothetical protein